MTTRSLSRRLSPALLLLCAFLPACGGGGGGAATGSVEGHVVFAAAAMRALSEAEPNDSIERSQSLGRLGPGERVAVRGSGTALDGSDPFDGYEVVLPARVPVRVTVRATDGGADFDVAVYAPTGLQVVATLRAQGPLETGTFVAKGTVEVVVQAVRGASGYDLTIEAGPGASEFAEAEPNDPDAQPLGDLTPGDDVRVLGEVGGEADGSDGFLVSCPATARVAVAATALDGASLRATLSDATADARFPLALETFAGEAGGARVVPAGTLLRIDVESAVGRGSYALSLSAAPPEVGPARAVRPSREARIAHRDAETVRLRRVDRDARFTRPSTDAEFVPGSILVGLERGDGGPALGEAQVAAHACARGPALDEDAFVAAFDVPAALSPEDGQRATISRALALRGAPGIRYAEPNRRRRATKTPNDPRYPEQWNYPLIRCPEAWNLTTGSSSVIVAVIDTGKTAHPDLTGKWTAGYDFISDSSVAGDGDGRDADPTDVGDGGGFAPSSFHGTHVAGTIGAATDNATGVSGVGWNVHVMPLRVLGIGGGLDSDLVPAIRYAAGLSNATGQVPAKRADVINMSVGGAGYSQALQDAVTAARDAGVVVCASAGNDGNSNPLYPAALSGVLSVAAVNRNSVRASYSNYGSTIDIAAPGGDSSGGILSTVYDDSSGTPVAGYARYAGTSMACPHVAGVAALVRAVDPTLTAPQVESILTSTALDLGTAGRDDFYGNGLVDAYAAVRKALDGVVPPTLALATESLSFDDSTTQNVTLSNAGAGYLTITGVSVSTVSGSPWLSASAYGSGDSTKSASGVRVSATSEGLGLGTHFGFVRVESNGGAKDILVALDVTPRDVLVRVLDAATLLPVNEALVPAGGDLAFVFDGLPAGAYRLVAGSDADADGILGEPGDWYGEVVGDVTVARGQVVSNLDVRVLRR